MAANDKLITLHTALVDAGNGYDEAIKDATDPRIAGLFMDMKALHQRHHSELHAILLGSGETPDDQGSFMSKVHRAVIGARAAITGLGTNALSSFVSGEQRLLSEYEEAIEANESDLPTVEKLSQQQNELVQKVAIMKKAADSV